MARVKRRAGQPAKVSRFSGLGTKTLTVVALFLTVRILLAQAPGAADTLVREQVDDQGYKYQVPNETLRKNKTLVGKEQTSVRSILSGGSLSDPAVRTRFRAYFTSYLFPMMTTEEGLRTIAQDRQRLLTDLLSSKSPEAHRDIVDLAFNSLSKIVQDPAYRPAARYNAMLIISNLNDVEPNNTAGMPQTLPEPMRTALPFILQQFQKTDRDDIKLAAVLGLSRHLEWENYKQPPSTPMQPALKAAAIKALSDLAAEKSPPDGRDADVHNWMRRRAIEGLTQYCVPRADADIAALMDRLVRDEQDALSVRLAAATSFGKMSLAVPAKIDAVATAKELGYLALVACDAELTRAEAARKAEFEHEARLAGTYTGGGEYSSGGGYGSPGGMPMPGSPGMGSPDGGMGPGMRQPLRPPPGASGLSGAMPGTEGGYGGYGEGGMAVDPSMQDPKHFRIEYLRRKLRQYVYAAQYGILGGDDRPPSKTGAAGNEPKTPPANQPPGGAQGPDKKGLYVVAKPAEKKEVDEVYQRVRKVAEAIESAGDKVLFHELVKDVRKQLTALESITKRLPPAGAAAPSSPIDDDAPTTAPAPGAKGKAAPPKGKAPIVPGKSAARPQARPQPNVFAKPNR